MNQGVIIFLIVLGVLLGLTALIVTLVLTLTMSAPDPKTQNRKARELRRAPLPKAPMTESIPSPLKRVVRTPQKSGGKFMKTVYSPGDKIGRLYTIDPDGVKHRLLSNIVEPIIDVAPFRDGLLVLLNYGNMVYISHENDTIVEFHLPCTENINQLVAFAEEVVGLSMGGHLYKLRFFNEEDYEWQRVKTMVSDIIYISASEDQQTLFVKTAEAGLVYDNTWDVVARHDQDSSVIRIYGFDENEYIDINQQGMMGQFDDGSPMENIYYGCFTNDGFVKVTYEHHLQGVQKVKCIGGHLYYIIQIQA